MARILGVNFAPYGRLVLLDAAGTDARVGDAVLVDTGFGTEVARCALATDAEGVRLPRCAGPATDADLARDDSNRARRAEILTVAADLVQRHGLPMTILAVDHVDRGEDVDRLAIIYYRAPHRVDFRVLVGELARALRSRVDLRQVGERDAAALVGGVGPCGRELCCSLVGPAVRPVRAVRGAEPAGACGRVQCCHAYEESGLGSLLRRRTPQG